VTPCVDILLELPEVRVGYCCARLDVASTGTMATHASPTQTWESISFVLHTTIKYKFVTITD